MNETVTITPGVWIGESELLFEGHLGDLDWHEHAFTCALLSLGDSTITLETPQRTLESRAVLASAATSHRLRFSPHDPVVTLYFAPHQPEFHRLRAASPTPVDATWNATWDAALTLWRDTRDASALRQHILDSWAAPDAHPDWRVTRVLQSLWRGEALRASPAEVAEPVGLSGSRLMHLIKAETGSTLRRLQRAYRFWHAAQAMLRDITFTEAAHAAEFADAAHFSRAFRDAYGHAPSVILTPTTTWARCASLG